MAFKLIKTALLPALFLLSAAGCCERERIAQRTGELYSQDAHVKSRAALNLARCGSEAAEAVPRLAQLLYDRNVGVQSAAAYALNRIDTPEARAIMNEIEQRRRKK